MSDNLNTHTNRKNFIKYVISEMSDNLNTSPRAQTFSKFHINRKNFNK